MKLTDLEPRWGQDVRMNHHGKGQSNFPPDGFRNAITFLCPHCRRQRLGVSFQPPLGPLDWLTPGQPIAASERVWTRESGEAFDTLTLSPSIDTSADPVGRIDFAGHWHVFIRTGEIS